MRLPPRSLIIPVVVLGLVASACTGDDDDASSTEETTAEGGADLDGEGLTIGLIRPPAGLFDLLGAAQAGALALAAEDIAAGGGVRGGPLTVVEGLPEPERSADLVFDDLVADGVNLVVGPSSSDEARLIIPKIAAADAVVCGASTTSPGLPALEPEGRFVRTSFDDNIVALHAFDRIRERTASIVSRPPKVTLVVRGDTYGDGISGSLAGLLNLVGTEVAVERYVPEDVLAEGLGERVVALGGDLVVIIGLEESPRQARLMQEAGVDPTTMMGLDGLATTRFAAKAGLEEPNLLDGLTAIGATGPIDFLTRLIDQDLSRDEVLYGAQAYDCAISIALAVEAADSTDGSLVSTALRDVTQGGTICTTYEQCLELLRAGEDIDYDGPSGGVALTEEGEPGDGRFITGKLVGGTFDIVSDLRIALEEIRDRVAPRLAGFIGDVQVALTQLGYYDGPINGIQTDEFTAAVAAFQTDAGLEPTGELDAATIAAIQDALADQGLLLDASVAEVQQVLTDLGYYSGPIDGRFTQEVSDAIAAFQTDLGVEPTGILDAATLRAIYEAGVQEGEEVEPPPTTVPPETTAPPTAPPTTAPPETTVPATTAPATTAPVTTAPVTTAPPTTVPVNPDSVLATLEANPGAFSTLSTLLNRPDMAGVRDQLNQANVEQTLFAPTDTALAAANVDAITPEQLSFHLVTQAVAITDPAFVDGPYPTAAGPDLTLTAVAPQVNGVASAVDPTDAPAGTGYVTAIDTLLTP